METRLRELARSRGLDPEEVLVIAYLDDLLLSLPPELVQEGLTSAQEELGTVGLTLNEAKTNAWAPQPPPPEVLTLLQVDDRWKPDGYRLLGTPLAGGRELALGSETFMDTFLRAKRREACRLVQRVAELPELVGEEWSGAQTAFQLLRQCAAQQIGHLLRTTPPGAIQEEAAAFDEEMERAAEKVMGLDPLTPAEKA